jgi:hypothetical protein
MGRPKLPKNEARKILIGAKFSPPEARSVEQSARDSNLDKSKWIRERLLEHAKLHPLSNPEGSIEYLAEATALDKANRVVATGSAILYHTSGTGEFFPEKISQATETMPPQSSTSLRTSTGHRYRLTEVEGICQGGNKPPHLHFEFTPVHAASEA